MSVMKSITLALGSLFLTAILPAQSLFFENFNGNSAGWTLGTSWQIGPAQAYAASGNCGIGDPGSDADGVPGGGVAGMVIGGPVPVNLGSFLYLESPVINLSGALAPVMLEFDRFLNVDYTPYMQSSVEVFDGTGWQPIFLTGGSPGVHDLAWTHLAYDITAYASATFRVRFGTMVGSTGAYTDCGGWNIDNVDIPGVIGCNGGGQAPTAGAAVFSVNGAGACFVGGPPVSSGLAGPYFAQASAGGSTTTFTFQGAPVQPIVFLSGNLNVGATPIPPYGQLDIGTPGFGGLSLLASGTDSDFVSSLFRTDVFGQQVLSFHMPASLAGTTTAFQAIFFHPSLLIRTSNVVEVSIVP